MKRKLFCNKVLPPATGENRSTNTEDQSDAFLANKDVYIIWCLPAAPPRQLQLMVVLAQTWTQTGRNIPARLYWRKAIATRVGDWRDPYMVENAWSVVWAPGQHTALAPWYPLDGRLGLTRPNQSASRVNKSYFPCHGLWVNLRRKTSLGEGGGCLSHWWLFLNTRQDSVRAPRTCLNPGWVVSHNRVYLLGIPNVLGSEETNCSRPSVLKLVYTL